MKKHETPMLDELEKGPWPSFISGIKRLRDAHKESRINITHEEEETLIVS